MVNNLYLNTFSSLDVFDGRNMSVVRANGQKHKRRFTSFKEPESGFRIPCVSSPKNSSFFKDIV